ncbi:MAG: hypothetical protein IIA99_05305 [Proteobacteria bacterium]|nr:hypothetical protein [Pseudomonadota bacterium]
MPNRQRDPVLASEVSVLKRWQVIRQEEPRQKACGRCRNPVEKNVIAVGLYP